MKILIVYASAGAGHFKAAEAIYNYLRDNYKGIEAKLIDVLNETNVFFRFNYSWGYTHLIKYTPFLWHWAFWITYNKTLRFLTRPLASWVDRVNTVGFAKNLILENPDYIISTHFLPPEIAAHLKNEKKIRSKLITVITDFQVHPFWINQGTDTYVVASSFTKKILISEGIKETMIWDFGIPIDDKFTKDYRKEELCNRSCTDSKKFTILVVTGSSGIGPIKDIVDLLHENMQILVVCAGNKSLFKKLNELNYENVKVFGFVNNMQELMAISDVIVTKPGGLSIAELLATELVPVFISAIPGQETGNIEALKSYGIGYEIKDIREIKRVLLDYKEHPEKLRELKDKIKKIKKPNATQELCNAICKDSGRAAS
jgi:processive 1,2-diacylglycerol beta-glucosyltransferase